MVDLPITEDAAYLSVRDVAALFRISTKTVRRWIKSGELQPVQNIVDGFENMPAALAELYSGTNTGVQICKVRGEPGINEKP